VIIESVLAEDLFNIASLTNPNKQKAAILDADCDTAHAFLPMLNLISARAAW
jgi:hypothetical protein